MCAGAYLPSTDKYDIPKSLGTRHRAAIGISKESDAIVVVVSEETGNISVAKGDTIKLVTPSELEAELTQAFGMEVCVYTSKPQFALPSGVKKMDLDELFAECDVVSLFRKTCGNNICDVCAVVNFC